MRYYVIDSDGTCYGTVEAPTKAAAQKEAVKWNGPAPVDFLPQKYILTPADVKEASSHGAGGSEG